MSKDGDDDLSKRVSRESLKRNKSTGSSGNVRFSEPLNDYADLENKYEDILGRSTEGMAEELEMAPDINTPAATLSLAGTVSETTSELDHVVSSVVEKIITGLTPVEETENPADGVSSQLASTVASFESRQKQNTNGVGFEEHPSKDSNFVGFEEQPSKDSQFVGFEDRFSFEDQTMNSSVVGFEDRPSKDVNRVNFDNHQSERALNSFDIEEQPMYKEAETNPDTFESFDGPTPEDIFDEIKVAHLEKAEMEGAQNLHSFVISKTYSSENVVVLLNLRRMKDGEWVLDKTIAQGLKSQTYGGLVSIDEYGFSTAPSTAASTHQPSTAQPSTYQPSAHQSPSIRPPMNEATSTAEFEPSTANVNGNGADIMDILKKMEDYVANVNKQIEAARKLAKNPPGCPEPHAEPSKPFEEEVPLVDLPFDERPLTDQLMKMFTFLVSQDSEVLNLCDITEECTSFDGNTQSAITSWLRSLIETVSSLCGWKIPFLWFLPSLNGNVAVASAAQLLAQSRAILEQASQSGVVIQLAAKSSKLFNFLPSPMSSSRTEIAVEAKSEKMNLASVSGSVKINSESASNLD